MTTINTRISHHISHHVPCSFSKPRHKKLCVIDHSATICIDAFHNLLAKRNSLVSPAKLCFSKILDGSFQSSKQEPRERAVKTTCRSPGMVVRPPFSRPGRKQRWLWHFGLSHCGLKFHATRQVLHTGLLSIQLPSANHLHSCKPVGFQHVSFLKYWNGWRWNISPLMQTSISSNAWKVSLKALSCDRNMAETTSLQGFWLPSCWICLSSRLLAITCNAAFLRTSIWSNKKLERSTSKSTQAPASAWWIHYTLVTALHEMTTKIALKPEGNLYEPRVFSLFCDRNPRSLSTKPSCTNRHLPWHALNITLHHSFATLVSLCFLACRFTSLALGAFSLIQTLDSWKISKPRNPKTLKQICCSWQSSRSIIQCLFSSVSILRAHLQEILDP